MASPNMSLALKVFKESTYLRSWTQEVYFKFRIHSIEVTKSCRSVSNKNSIKKVKHKSLSNVCCPVQRHPSSFQSWHTNSISLLVLPSTHSHGNVQAFRMFSTLGKDEPNLYMGFDPYKVVELEMTSLADDIKKQLNTDETLLNTMSHYYFNGKGKSFRPLVALLMSKACNSSTNISDSILLKQKTVAIVSEMIHTASLVHDDVIDGSDTRRGQSTLNIVYGQKNAILVGDYILSQASIALASTGSTQVITILSTVLEDLVSGEFMQLGSKEDENERFSHYLKKTYKKTASLIANTCKAVAILANCDDFMSEKAYQYGRNLGIAFQLVDDLLDFVSSELVMGKPTAADLKLGLATAPVLFAAQEFPELHPMIMRRFSLEGDVETARYLVAKSDGVEQTKLLATKHSEEAINCLKEFAQSDARTALQQLATLLLKRKS